MSTQSISHDLRHPLARFRLFGRLMLLVTVPLLLLVGTALYNAQREYRNAQQTALNTASNIARRAASRLDEHFDEIDQFLIAVTEIARGALTRGENVDAKLARVLAAMPQHIDGLAVLSLDGRYVAATTVAPETRARVQVNDRNYFRDALRRRSLAAVEPVHSRTLHRWVSIAARAVLDDNKAPIGVVSMFIRIDYYHNLLVPLGLPLGTLMTVFSDRGTGISSTEEPIAAIGRDFTASETVRRALQERDFAARTVASDGHERLVAYAAGEKLPWQVEVGLPLASTLAPALQRLKERLLYTFAAFLTGLVIAYWLARWIARPLHGLTQDAVRLGQGDWSARASVEGYYEVQRLGEAFNRMARSVDHKQRELHESEERFRSLVLLSSDWYWTRDAEHRLTSHTEGRLGGIVMHTELFRGETGWDMPGAEPVGTTWEAHRALVVERKPWRDLVVRYTDNDGRVQFLSGSGEPTYNAQGEFTGYRGVARLVTERYQLEAERAAAQTALRDSEERLRATLEYSPNVAVQWFDRDGRVRFWNRASAVIFGWTAQEAMGRTLGEIGLYSAAQVEAFIAALHTMNRDSPRIIPAETKFRRKNGTEGVIVSTLFPISSPAGEPLFACMDVDVTQRVQLEKELRERMELFRVTLDTPAVCVALIRRRDNLALLTNRATNETFNVDLARTGWDVTSHWERKDDLVEMLKRVERDGYVRDMEVPVHIPGGSRMWAQLSAHPARFQGEEVMVVTLNDITARKALEAERQAALAALRESESKFRALTALSSDWYWEQDADLRFTFIGRDDVRQALPLIGRRREELNAEPVSETWEENRARLARREKFRDVLFRYVTDDGVTHYVSISGEPRFSEAGEFQGYRGTGTEVTERVQLQNQLRERVNLFQVTLETTPVGIGLVRRSDNQVLLANRAGYALFKRDPEQPWDVTGSWADIEDMKEMLRRVQRDGEMRSMEARIKVPGRENVWTSMSAQPATYLGEPVLVVTVTDVTDRKQLEAQREALLAEARAAHERLRHLSIQLLDAQEAERRQIAHELHDEIGQNLSALKLFAGHLRRGVPVAAQSQVDEWIGIVDQTVTQVRDLSRLLRPVQLDHMGLAPALRALLDTQARAAGWSVHFAGDPLLPRVNLRQETVAYRVVQEGLTNAARHADAAHVSLTLALEGGQLKITLTDDGRGFDADAAQQRVQQGYSMGLLGMEERVRLADGTITIESAPARGTRIMVTLPIAKEEVSA